MSLITIFYSLSDRPSLSYI